MCWWLKYADHLPLYRQSGIYAREGVDLERSTLADWVGRSGRSAMTDARNAFIRCHSLGTELSMLRKKHGPPP